jgi:hypothetical protein
VTQAWWAVTVLDTLYALLIAGTVWWKMRKLRMEIQRDFQELRGEIPAVLLGETFLKDELARVDAALRGYNARLVEIETLLDKMLNGRHE